VDAAMDAMLTIRERMLMHLETFPEAPRVDGWVAELAETGTWPDIDYAGSSTTDWEPAAHLRRLLAITRAWYAPGSAGRGDTVTRAAVDRALDAWLRQDLRRPWWWDSIGAPQTLSYTMLMLDDGLSPFQMEKGVEILERAELTATGQNMVWQAEITARRAVIQRDPNLLQHAFELIAAELKVSRNEGIQPDFSFHQHGSCLYNHGYGAGFAVDNARLAGLTAGTPFEYAPDKLELLTHYVLDGSQWLAHGRHSDFGADGRQITRAGQSAAYLAQAARLLLAQPTGREQECRNLLARVSDDAAPPLVGNRHFYCSDIMVHHRPSWYMSARFYSRRTCNTDGLSGCDEGLLSHYLAEGATCIMRHGSEYADLFPVWDWQRIPGTTVEHTAHVPGDPKRIGAVDFAGGVSDATNGVAAFELQRDSLRGRKAWFFFGDVVVCLGTGIRCHSAFPVTTTVNQCRLLGPVTAGADGVRTVGMGERDCRARWVHHDGVAYVFPAVTDVHLSNRSQEGSWRRISAQRSGARLADDVFCLSLDHGVGPNGGSYAYAVLPGIDLDAVPAAVRQLPFTILANSEEVQAVSHGDEGALGVVLHRPGRQTMDGWELASDRACAVLCRRVSSAWKLWFADPTAQGGTARVSVTPPGGSPVALELALPQGAHAGSAVTAMIP
jgi:chondroitin AC lyase